jgi:hypothetical protein
MPALNYQKGIKNTIPLKIESKSTKYTEINLTKEAKELCTENYKTLLKKLKKT